MVCQAASQTRFRALKHECGVAGSATIIVRVIACFQPLRDCQVGVVIFCLYPNFISIHELSILWFQDYNCCYLCLFRFLNASSFWSFLLCLTFLYVLPNKWDLYWFFSGESCQSICAILVLISLLVPGWLVYISKYLGKMVDWFTYPIIFGSVGFLFFAVFHNVWFSGLCLCECSLLIWSQDNTWRW